MIYTLLTSCKKEGNLFPEFNNENLTVHFTDTLNLLTSLLKDDSVRTDVASLNLLGIYNDTIMGFASSSFYTEITLSGANVNFGNNAIIDSAVLSLKYASPTSLYGSYYDPMSINVYRLNEQLSQSAYYCYHTADYSSYPTPLGSLTYLPYMNDSLQIIQNGDTVWQEPHIRIKLDNTFGQELLNAGNNTNSIANNSALKTIVNGLYITPTTSVATSTLAKGHGSIIYFDVNSSLSTLTLYYHNDLGTGKSYSFLINSESKKFNHFEHNYTGTDVEKQLSRVGFDPTITYVQSMGGVKTKLSIPNLRNLSKDGKIIINKAEVIFTINAGTGINLAPIPTLALTGINSNGESVFLTDFFEGATYFGGNYNSSSQTYTFNIARHIQELVNNNATDYGLYLISSGSSVMANRSIINSFNHPSNKIQLNITYSKL